MRLGPQLALAVALFAQLGCAESPTAPADNLIAQSTALGLTLTNRGNGPAAYFVISVDALAYTDFIPCEDPAGCRHLEPGESTLIPWTQLFDYKGPGQEYYVIWTYAPHQHYTAQLQSS
jgi:hypothetical protein